MIIKEIKGDLLQLFADNELDVIAHGANCKGIMGAGIAKSIITEYPEIREPYEELCGLNDDYLAGTAQCLSVDNKTLVNLFTQKEMGANARYEYIYTSMVHMICQLCDIYAHRVLPVRVGIPWIGCGIGGLDKPLLDDIISDLIESDIVEGMELYIVEYNK